MVKWFSRDKPPTDLIDTDPESVFVFSLTLPGRKELLGKLVDLSMDGVAISFPLDHCPDFEHDERVRLSLKLIETGKTMPVDALVTDSQAGKNTRLCQLSFIDTSSLLRDLDPTVMSHFNRRGAFRVRTDPLKPVRADVMWQQHSAEGWIIDISTTGVQLGLPVAAARQIGREDVITLVFRLPGGDAPMKILGKTAHVSPGPREARYGISFVRAETPDIRKYERDISRFVMQRQLATLKMRPGETAREPVDSN